MSVAHDNCIYNKREAVQMSILSEKKKLNSYIIVQLKLLLLKTNQQTKPASFPTSINLLFYVINTIIPSLIWLLYFLLEYVFSAPGAKY